MPSQHSWLGLTASLLLGSQLTVVQALPMVTNDIETREKRDRPGFDLGQPLDGKGKGAPILGGSNRPLDLQNPSNLGQQSTDNGVVPNLKWSFSLSKTRITDGGWSREQVIQDLPQSHDVAAAQQHLVKGAIRELHWHKTAEWGFV